MSFENLESYVHKKIKLLILYAVLLAACNYIYTCNLNSYGLREKWNCLSESKMWVTKEIIFPENLIIGASLSWCEKPFVFSVKPLTYRYMYTIIYVLNVVCKWNSICY